MNTKKRKIFFFILLFYVVEYMNGKKYTFYHNKIDRLIRERRHTHSHPYTNEIPHSDFECKKTPTNQPTKININKCGMK